MSRSMIDPNVFLYVPKEELESAVRTYAYKHGHGKRIAGLTLQNCEIELQDGDYVLVWHDPEIVKRRLEEGR